MFFDEVPNLTKAFPTHFLEPCLYEGAGVTINRIQNPSDYVFMSGFFDGNNEMRLLRRDGKIITRWTMRFSEIFPDPDHLLHPPATDWNTYIHGACLLPDGSVVFNFEYGGLVKLDRAGNVVWTLPRETHHSLERAEKADSRCAGDDGKRMSRSPVFRRLSRLTTKILYCESLNRVPL